MRLGKKLDLKQNTIKENKDYAEQQKKVEEFKIQIDFEKSQSNGKQMTDQKFQVIYLQPNISEALIINEDSTYWGQYENRKQHGFGKIFIKSYDAHCNSDDFVFEGQFEKGEISGQGTLFHGRSNKKKIVGVFAGQRILEKIQEFDENGNLADSKQLKLSQQSTIFQNDDDRGANKLFRIKSNKPVQTQVAQKQGKTTQKWKKYDVELGKDDSTNLLVNKALTENTVEAIINSLNYYDAKCYFSLSTEQEIRSYKRTIIINYSYLQSENRLLELFSHFEGIHYRFWWVFQKIFFALNQNGQWYLMQVDFENELKMKVLDPQSKKKPIFYIAQCKALWLIIEAVVKLSNSAITWKQKDITVLECPQLTQPQDSSLFLYSYCKSLIMNQEMNFSQNDIDELRQREVFDIIKKEK